MIAPDGVLIIAPGGLPMIVPDGMPMIAPDGLPMIAPDGTPMIASGKPGYLLITIPSCGTLKTATGIPDSAPMIDIIECLIVCE